MKKAALLSFFLLIFYGARGQVYSVASIDPAIKTRASAVVRLDQQTVTIKSLNEVILNVRKAVTVLNSNGENEASLVLGYDKSTQIRSLQGTVFNEFGLPAGKISERNFMDESAVSDFSLFEDSRMKRYSPAIGTYPYTIEYEFEIRFKQTLLLPEWNPGHSSGVSVEKSELKVIINPDLKIRYKALNVAQPDSELDKDGNSILKWEVVKLMAARSEPFSPHPDSYLPTVKLALDNFRYLNVSGTFSNWNEYGQWMNDNLLKDRRDISDETARLIKDLVSNISDPKLKAKRIYEYVQEKTRYISVQIGIGGFQPMRASEVDRLGYGDCKGLVNYTQSLLSAVGIESYYAVVEAGNFKIDALPDFASMSQFNHVILALPFENDTIWVDCTSKTLPFGYLGEFTDDRLVLACTSSGGKLMRTPKYTSKENLQSRTGRFQILENGDMSGDIITVFEGTQYGNRENIINVTETEQVKRVKDFYPVDMRITGYKLEQNKSLHPATIEKLSFTSSKYASSSNGRLYIRLNALNPIGNHPREVSNRINPVYINRGYTDTDSLVFKLPDGYVPDTRPKNIEIKTDFGEFSYVLEIANGEANFKRFVHLKDGWYGPEKYNELVDFYSKIHQSDNYQLTLLKHN